MSSDGTNIVECPFSGPFRFTRNPLYVALALVMNTPWPLLTLMPVILLVDYGVVLGEERHLAEDVRPPIAAPASAARAEMYNNFTARDGGAVGTSTSVSTWCQM
jgi:hypothetical protein